MKKIIYDLLIIICLFIVVGCNHKLQSKQINKKNKIHKLKTSNTN